MKRKYSYKVDGKNVEREYSYIPVRYILAMLITVLEIATIIGIVIALCYYVPYFYIAVGVEIYEYKRGFIHAKSYLCDGVSAMIGTINLDYRSLVHHFECGVWMYETSTIADLKADIEDTIAQSISITPDSIKTNIVRRAFRAFVRIFAPLM